MVGFADGSVFMFGSNGRRSMRVHCRCSLPASFIEAIIFGLLPEERCLLVKGGDRKGEVVEQMTVLDFFCLCMCNRRGQLAYIPTLCKV